MSAIRLSGFADEITPSFEHQLEVLQACGMHWLELRSADGINVADLSDQQVEQIAGQLERAGIRVSSIGSPIGKIAITDSFESHFDSFRRVVEIAKRLHTRNIRMFSFYDPDRDTELNREEVFRRVGQMVEYAVKEDVILLHENEKGIYGDVAPRCAELLEQFYGKHFQAVFDFANFVECGQDTLEAYELLAPYIRYVHIKDAKSDVGLVVPAGMGDGHLAEILGKLQATGYEGFLSLEPHLTDFAGLQQLEQDAKERKAQLDGESAWKTALQALRGILQQQPWEETK